MGPSSSHTIGSHRAAERFRKEHPEAGSFRVTLYGSLTATGKGHMINTAILQGLAPFPVDILREEHQELPLHPKGMRFKALNAAGTNLAA